MFVQSLPLLPESPSTISFPDSRSCNLCFITYTSLPYPPLSFPLCHPVMFLLSAPTCGLWLFEERQRWPLKTATAKFVRGHGNECMPLSTSLSWLHIRPPPNTVPHLLSAPHNLTHKRSHQGPPIAQIALLIMYLRYLAPVKTALGWWWKVARQLGRGGCVGPWGGSWAHGYHYWPGFYVNTGLGQQGLIE